MPFNADFEGGYADAPEGVAESVRLCCGTGVSGLSIEDSTDDASKPLYDFDLALARVKAARAAIDKAGGDVLFTARTEGFIRGRPDLDETIRRLKAFSEAGADCLYAPGITTREQIGAVIKAVAPKPVNVLIGWGSDLTVSDLAALGTRRISVGGALARAAWGGMIGAAKLIAEAGSFKGFAGTPSQRRAEPHLQGRHAEAVRNAVPVRPSRWQSLASACGGWRASPRRLDGRTYMIRASGWSALTLRAAISASSASMTMCSAFVFSLSPTVKRIGCPPEKASPLSGSTFSGLAV